MICHFKDMNLDRSDRRCEDAAALPLKAKMVGQERPRSADNCETWSKQLDNSFYGFIYTTPRQQSVPNIWVRVSHIYFHIIIYVTKITRIKFSRYKQLIIPNKKSVRGEFIMKIQLVIFILTAGISTLAA